METKTDTTQPQTQPEKESRSIPSQFEEYCERHPDASECRVYDV